MTLTDEELLARARLGEEDAFSELYRLHFKAVRGVGRAILHRQDVEDLCQDTFLRAFTRLDQFEEKCTFRTWVTRIAINECLAVLRARRHVTDGDSYLVEMGNDFFFAANGGCAVTRGGGAIGFGPVDAGVATGRAPADEDGVSGWGFVGRTGGSAGDIGCVCAAEAVPGTATDAAK